MNSFFRGFFRAPISQFVLVAIIALAMISPAFCGEIHDAAADGDLAKVKALLTVNPALVSSKDINGRTPLHLAAQENRKEIANLLVARRAEVDATDKDGSTPLHLAVQQGNMEIAELLLVNKAKVNAKDNSGRTPLTYALNFGRKDMADLLRQHGGRVEGYLVLTDDRGLSCTFTQDLSLSLTTPTGGEVRPRNHFACLDKTKRKVEIEVVSVESARGEVAIQTKKFGTVYRDMMSDRYEMTDSQIKLLKTFLGL